VESACCVVVLKINFVPSAELILTQQVVEGAALVYHMLLPPQHFIEPLWLEGALVDDAQNKAV